MSSQFWFIAGLLTGVAATAVAIPLRRAAAGKAGSRTLRAVALAGGGVAVFALVVVSLYALLGSPRQSEQPAAAAPAAPAAPAAAATAPPDPLASLPVASLATLAPKALSMEAATAQLEARLNRDGGSASDWQLLAQSYEFLGRTADAERARAHVSQTDAGTAPDLAISGTVSVDSSLVSRIPQGATLFIYAKAADSSGPPLAVLRTNASAWPVSFRLDDSLAMIPTRRLSQFQQVIVEARISRTGQATPAAGDLYVTSDVLRPGAGKKLSLIIKREIG